MKKLIILICLIFSCGDDVEDFSLAVEKESKMGEVSGFYFSFIEDEACTKTIVDDFGDKVALNKIIGYQYENTRDIQPMIIIEVAGTKILDTGKVDGFNKTYFAEGFYPDVGIVIKKVYK